MLVVRGSIISSPGLLEWSRYLPSSAPLGEVILPSYRGTVQYLLKDGKHSPTAYLFYATVIMNWCEKGITYLILRSVTWQRGFSHNPSGYKNFYTVWIVFFERYVLVIGTFRYSVLSFLYVCM